jgi:hypothetical protein
VEIDRAVAILEHRVPITPDLFGNRDVEICRCRFTQTPFPSKCALLEVVRMLDVFGVLFAHVVSGYTRCGVIM